MAGGGPPFPLGRETAEHKNLRIRRKKWLERVRLYFHFIANIQKIV